MGFGLWDENNRDTFTNYARPGGITRLHVYLATAYMFKTIIHGCYYVPETEEDLLEDVLHLEFLLKYKL
tara:strand:+ start:188 stop:394 length:207 start_codon:yes stop_codon:yes gene_type:complete